jgi:exo-1,4-beta-D-glucosaminidase
MDLSEDGGSRARLGCTGEALSLPGFDASGFYAVSVPNTVVGALVENGTYPDPYFGMNLRSIPGTTYPIGQRFTLLPTPDDSPFKPSWWYRTEFDARRLAPTVFLRLRHQSREIWLNGAKIAGPARSRASSVGTSRRISFVRPAREMPWRWTSGPRADDLGITWVDWNPTPPARTWACMACPWRTGARRPPQTPTCLRASIFPSVAA